MESSRKRIHPLWYAALAFLIPLLFALYTGHAWEDYYITYRASHNLAIGHGLVFTPGERVQTFTSPLGTLLPALCAWITGGNHDDAALWLYRLICCGFLACSAGLLARLAARHHFGGWASAGLIGLFLTDAKIIDFTINGMESALMIFFLVWCVDALLAGELPATWRLAAGFAGLMWTRPDGFVPAGALALAWLIFGQRVAGGTSGQRQRRLGASILLSLALYAPWFAWAWWYYGSPIPQTIAAKGVGMSLPAVLRTWLAYPLGIFSGQGWTSQLFSPAYYRPDSWPGFLPWISLALAVGAMLYCLVPKAHPAGRMASCAFLLGGFYLAVIPLYPWYLPAWEVLALIALAFAAEDAARGLARLKLARGLSALRISIVVLIALSLGVLAGSAREFRVSEALIERQGREQIGLWLRAHASPGDTVFLEPLGYIGYYSNLKTYDYPGLSSPEVVAARKAGAVSWSQLIHALHPTWLVLRPFEAVGIDHSSHSAELLHRDYAAVKGFTCYDQIRSRPFLPGRYWLLVDSQFIIYHRRKSPDAAAH